ncbi:hypothetical protein [Halosimplex sp. J119]
MSQLTDLTLNRGSTKDKNVKMDASVLESIDAWKDEVDNMHASKLVGEALSEILLNDPIAEMEKQVEQELADEISTVPVVSSKGHLPNSAEERVYDDQYLSSGEFQSLETQDDTEYDDVDAIRTSYTVREEDAEELRKVVNTRQQSYQINRAIVRLLNMPFRSRLHRLQSKQQLLSHVRGHDIVSPTEWIYSQMEADEGMFADVLRGAEAEIDVSEMEPKEFDNLDGLDPSKHNLTQVRNGEKKKHALWAVARYKELSDPQDIRDCAEDVYPGMVDATYDSYTEYVLDKIYSSGEGEMDNFVEQVEDEIRSRTNLKSETGNVDGANALQNVLERDRPGSAMGILAETQQVIECLHRMAEYYKTTPGNTSKERKQLRDDIAFLALNHFHDGDCMEVNEIPIFERLNDNPWFVTQIAKEYKNLFESNEKSVDGLLIEPAEVNHEEAQLEKEAEEDFEDELAEYKKGIDSSILAE